MLSLQTVISICNLARPTLSIVKRVYHISQALRLNCICSETNSFDKCCNDLERFLLERGYNSKLVRKEILLARKISRNGLLDKKKSQGNDSKLTFNVTYYPVFRHLKSQLKNYMLSWLLMKNIKKYFLKYQLLVSRTIRI